MCFITSRTARAKIAKEDIICFKCLYEPNDSIIFHHRFYKGRSSPKTSLVKKYDSYDGTYGIHHGYHSFKTEKDARTSGYFYDKIAKFVIPKGTRYYSNHTEYVSEQIKLIG